MRMLPRADHISARINPHPRQCFFDEFPGSLGRTSDSDVSDWVTDNVDVQSGDIFGGNRKLPHAEQFQRLKGQLPAFVKKQSRRNGASGKIVGHVVQKRQSM